MSKVNHYKVVAEYNDPVRIQVSAAERRAERLSEATCRAAMAAVRQHGYAILEDAIEPAHLDLLRERMTRDSRLLLRGAALLPSLFWSANGARPGHLQQSVPRSGRLVFRDVVCNPLANQVTSQLLGPGAFFSFPVYNCNVNCPGSVDQDLHFDPAPPGALVVNIALRDVSEADGAIELWPGSHADPGEVNPIPPVRQDQRRLVAPPVRGATRKGSLIIRDLALWHRGRANPSAELRHMIAILHYPAHAVGHRFYWEKQPARFADAVKDAFRDSPIRPNVAFTRLPVPNLLSGPLYELGQAVRRIGLVRKLARAGDRLLRAVAPSDKARDAA